MDLVRKWYDGGWEKPGHVAGFDDDDGESWMEKQ